MVGKGRRERLEKQRAYQDGYREEQAERARPSRDDVARMLLYYVVKDVRTGSLLDRLMDKVVDELVKQGFDRRETDLFVEELVEKYQRLDLPAQAPSAARRKRRHHADSGR